MRPNVKKIVEIVSMAFPVYEPLYEFGAFQVAEQRLFADLRPLFPGKTYVGCDMREGPGVDKILNLHQLDVPSGSVGTVLCLDTLEHVEYPRKALAEMYRILQPNGMLVISSVMDFPIHDYPYDYWRFTPEAFKSLLQPFAHAFVGYQGPVNYPHTVVGIGFKGVQPSMSIFQAQYDEWQRKDRKTLTQRVRQFLPPVCVPVVGKVYKSVVSATVKKG